MISLVYDDGKEELLDEAMNMSEVAQSRGYIARAGTIGSIENIS